MRRINLFLISMAIIISVTALVSCKHEMKPSSKAAPMQHATSTPQSMQHPTSTPR